MKKILLLLASACALSLAAAPTKYLKYVELTGTQYFRTEFVPTANTVVEAQVALRDVSANRCIFCARTYEGGVNKGTYTLFMIPASGGSTWRYDYNTGTKSSAKISLATNTVQYLRMAPDGLFLQGTTQYVTNTTPQFADVSTKMAIGASHNGTGFPSPGNFCKGRYYGFKIWDSPGGTLMHDFVPAKAMDGEVERPCLWDRVTAKPFFATLTGGSPTEITAGPEVTLPQDISLREDVLNRGFAFTPFGTQAHPDGYGCARLFDGVTYTTSTLADALLARWLGTDASEQGVSVGSGYFSNRSGALVAYTLHKVSMRSPGVHCLAPTAWRIEGVAAKSAEDVWVTVDEQTAFVWPGSPDMTAGDVDPASEADSTVRLEVPAAMRKPYRKLRFVPTDSYAKSNSASEYPYSLMEVDFRVADAEPGFGDDELVISGVPSEYGVADPAYGSHAGYVAEQEYTLTAPATCFANAAETLEAVCTGWKLYSYDNDGKVWVFNEEDPNSQGTGNVCTYVHPGEPRKLEWQYKLQAKVEVSASGAGTADFADGTGPWFDFGSEVTLVTAATGDDVFRRWDGVPADAVVTDGRVTFTITEPISVVARYGGVRYVSTKGKDSDDGRSDTTPFKTVAKAITDLGTVGGIVYIADGTYSEAKPGVNKEPALRISNDIELVGHVGDVSKVALTVAQDSDKYYHLLHIEHPQAKVRWVTLTGGRTGCEGNEDKGGVLTISSAGGIVEDCVISGGICDRWGQVGAGAYMAAGRVSRTRFTNNKLSNADAQYGAALQLSGGLVEDCLFDNNDGYKGGAVALSGGKLVNCTVAKNTGNTMSGVYICSSSAKVVNTAIFGNTLSGSAAASAKVYAGSGSCFINCASDVEISGGVNCRTGESGFVNLSGGDYHLGSTSICLDGGADRGDYGTVSLLDYGNQPRVVGSAVDIGCYENQQDNLECDFGWEAESRIVPTTVTLTGNVLGTTAEVSYLWVISNQTTGASVTVPYSTSPVYAFETGDPGLYAVTLKVSAGANEATKSRTSLFRLSVSDLYVVNGNSSARFPYATEETAAGDVATALEVSAPGSTVHVMPGTYTLSSEISVSQAVRIVGEGRKNTDVVLSVPTERNVRVMSVNATGAAVCNLTLDGGKAGYNNSNAGGCLWLKNDGGMVSNCVLRAGTTGGGWGDYAGGAYIQGGLLTHCLITGCSAWTDNNYTHARVVEMEGGTMSNCLITENNMNPSEGPVIVLKGSSMMENCTFVGNGIADGRVGVSLESYSATARNCAIFGTTPNGAHTACGGTLDTNVKWPWRYYNCASDSSISGTLDGTTYSGMNCQRGVSQAASLQPGNYRPVKHGPLINNSATPTYLPEVDLAGKPRVYKGGLDIGCYEDFDSCLVLTIR